jgi:C4-type Zn-finger protein
MATLNLDTNEFADIAIIWLFDQIMNPEQVQSEKLLNFIEDNRTKIRTPLMKYYLDSGSEARTRYKRIKGVFDGSDDSIQQIRIGPSEKLEKENKKESIVKKIIKKILAKEELTLEDMKILKEINE